VLCCVPFGFLARAGGTQEPSEFVLGVHTLGMQRASAAAPDRTAAGLVQAALAHGLSAGLARTTLRGFTRAAPPPSLDFSNHCLRVADVTRAAAPPNLFITPSVVNSEEDAAPLETALMDPGAACGCRSDSWRQAIAPMRGAMAATPGRWVLFFDTDAELRERAPSRLALAVAERVVLMLSADWRAFIRLKADSRNSLFRFLEKLHTAGLPHAKIDVLLANAIPKTAGAPVDIAWPSDVASVERTPPPAGTPPPKLRLQFTPVRATQRELPQIAGNIYAHVDDTPASRALWFSEAAATGELEGFFRRYVRALSLFAPNVDQVSTGTGVPIVSLKTGQAYTIGGVRVRCCACCVLHAVVRGLRGLRGRAGRGLTRDASVCVCVCAGR
jgi:hypothetical protein